MSVVLENEYVLTVEQREKNNRLWDELVKAFEGAAEEMRFACEEDAIVYMREIRREMQNEKREKRTRKENINARHAR